MKKILLLGCCTFLGIGTANAISRPNLTMCESIVCDGPATEATMYSAHCQMMTHNCYQNSSGQTLQITSCSVCDSGYDLVSSSYDSAVCPDMYYSYNDCVRSCTGCTNCTSDTSWSAGNTGYEKKVTRTCDCNTCRTSTSYRCAAGYYGSSTNGTSGCMRCPSSGGVYGTSVAGSTSITSCYIPAGAISWTDSTGTYVCGEDSYYAN